MLVKPVVLDDVVTFGNRVRRERHLEPANLPRWQNLRAEAFVP
jgi:hypothetical protein